METSNSDAKHAVCVHKTTDEGCLGPELWVPALICGFVHEKQRL